MCLPLFVVPPALTTVDTRDAAGRGGENNMDFSFLALTEVKRAVREQGLPRLGATCSPCDAARWLLLIVSDQTIYHNRNYRKLEHAERRLTTGTNLLFLAAVTAVVVQFFVEWRWLLLVTAAGPAFAAASHGVLTRLGIVHRAALSRDLEQELRRIGDTLLTIIGRDMASEDDWREVRRLATRAAEAMGRENQSWHSLVRRYTDLLP
jgi:hypothetical protein